MVFLQIYILLFGSFFYLDLFQLNNKKKEEKDETFNCSTPKEQMGKFVDMGLAFPYCQPN